MTSGRGLSRPARWLIVAAAAFLATGVPLALPGHPAGATSAAHPVVGGIVPCPPGDTGDTCAAMPCPTDVHCGMVVAGPTQDLGSNQFVYLSFSGFAPGETGITVYFCSDPGASTTLGTSPPQCANGDSPSESDARQFVPVFPAVASSALPPGTASASMQAAEVSAPSDPIPSAQFERGVTVPGPGFYCDGTLANACAVVITDADITPGNPVSGPANSVMIPISFAPATSGCPNAPVVSTESDFGIDVLMPELARSSCAEDPSKAVIPFETATDGLNAVTDLASSAQQIAFTDDPEAADQQAQLAKGHFALIPVALSADTVAFYAQLGYDNNTYSVGQMDLSPTMAAGLLTSAPNYSTAATTDDVVPCSGASLGKNGKCLFGPAPCYGLSACSLYSQLNYVNGFRQFVTYLALERSDHAGVTDSLLHWLCTAPVVPLDFGVQPHESKSGAQELQVGLGGILGPPATSCPLGQDQLPTVPNAQTGLIQVNDPSQQALKADQFVFSGSPEPAAGFADMNWAEARYYGMSVAALQNAAGTFVAPSAASLDAAVNDAVTNPDGTLSFQNLTSDPTAYPMPSVIYAVVSTSPMPASQATPISYLLSQLLQLTGPDASGPLPQGFVPLPTSLYDKALADVKSDIKVLPTGKVTGGAGGGSTGAARTTTSGATGSSPPSAIPASAPLIGSTGSGSVAAHGSGPAETKRAGHRMAAVLLGPDLPGYELAATTGDSLLTETLVAGLAALTLGLLLVVGGMSASRRRRPVIGPGTSESPAAPTTEPDP